MVSPINMKCKSLSYPCRYTLQENWVPGYGIAYGMFAEMLIYCFIGTKATIAVSA